MRLSQLVANLDNELFAVVEQCSAGVMLMKLHLMKCVADDWIFVVDQSQTGDVHEVMAEIF